MKSGKAIRIFSEAFDMQVSKTEAREVVMSLVRKAERMGLDDRGEILVARLEVAYQVSIAELAKVAYKTWN